MLGEEAIGAWSEDSISRLQGSISQISSSRFKQFRVDSYHWVKELLKIPCFIVLVTLSVVLDSNWDSKQTYNFETLELHLLA